MAKDVTTPITASGMGSAIGGIALNTIKGQSALIDALLGNAIVFWIFALGCFALALGIGKTVSYMWKTKELSALSSFGYSTGSSGVLPFVLGGVMLTNAQNNGDTLEIVVSNYVTIIGVVGLISLIIGIYLIIRK